MRQLTEEEFLSCFASPMSEVLGGAAAAVDIWPYVERLAPQSLDIGEIGDVAHVYQDANERFHHVLLATDQYNVFVAIIVNLSTSAIVGHRLLDMNRLYGIKG